MYIYIYIYKNILYYIYIYIICWPLVGHQAEEPVQSGKLVSLQPCNALQCCKFTGASLQACKFTAYRLVSYRTIGSKFVSCELTAPWVNLKSFTFHWVSCLSLGSPRESQKNNQNSSLLPIPSNIIGGVPKLTKRHQHNVA